MFCRLEQSMWSLRLRISSSNGVCLAKFYARRKEASWEVRDGRYMGGSEQKRKESGRGEPGSRGIFAALLCGFSTAGSQRLADLPKATSNKCIPSSNKCLTSSNKKLLVTSASLLVTSALLVVTRFATSNKCIASTFSFFFASNSNGLQPTSVLAPSSDARSS